MNAVKGLFLAAIGVYVGVALIPGINTTVATITTPTYSVGVAGMAPVLLIIFMALIVFLMMKSLAD